MHQLRHPNTALGILTRLIRMLHPRRRLDRSVDELLPLRNGCVFGGLGSLLIMPSSRGVKSKCWPTTLMRSFWLYGIQILIHLVCKFCGRGVFRSLE
jgi:hypothetical protein